MKNAMRMSKINKEYDPVIEIPHIRHSFLKPYHIQQPDVAKKDAPTEEVILKNWFSIPCNSFKSFK